MKLFLIVVLSLSAAPAFSQDFKLRGNDPRAVVDERWKIIAPGQTLEFRSKVALDILDSCHTWTQRLREEVVADVYLDCLRKKAKEANMQVVDLEDETVVSKRF